MSDDVGNLGFASFVLVAAAVADERSGQTNGPFSDLIRRDVGSTVGFVVAAAVVATKKYLNEHIE